MSAPLPQPQPQPLCSTRLLCYLALVLALTLFLVLTYQTCVLCVCAIALVSLLLIQIPLMPVVFCLSMMVLLYHAVDYRNATVKVEVPLSNFVYVPTLDDMRKYVHLATPGTPAINEAPATTPPPWRPRH